VFCSDCGSRCNQWLKCNIRGECCPLNYSVGPQPSDADASEYSMLYLPFFFQICTCVLLMIRYSKHIQCQRRPSLQFCCVSLHYKYHTSRCHLVVYSRSCSVPPNVPVHFFTKLEVQEPKLPVVRGAGTRFRCVPRHYNHRL